MTSTIKNYSALSFVRGSADDASRGPFDTDHSILVQLQPQSGSAHANYGDPVISAWEYGFKNTVGERIWDKDEKKEIQTVDMRPVFNADLGNYTCTRNGHAYTSHKKAFDTSRFISTTEADNKARSTEWRDLVPPASATGKVSYPSNCRGYVDYIATTCGHASYPDKGPCCWTPTEAKKMKALRDLADGKH